MLMFLVLPAALAMGLMNVDCRLLIVDAAASDDFELQSLGERFCRICYVLTTRDVQTGRFR